MEIELFEIDRQIKQIENRDDCFEDNPKWKELRRQQDALFYKLAERKLQYNTEKYRQTQNERYLILIEKYKKYLEDAKTENEKEGI